MGLKVVVYVIVVTYNGRQWYDRCFSSLHSSSHPVEIIVFDNASSDNSVNYIRTKFPQIHVIESSKNMGFGSANNIAIRYALNNGADYIFLLNQDAWIEEDTISRLLSIHKKNPQYGLLSPFHLNAEKDGIEQGFLHNLIDKNKTDIKFVSDIYLSKVNNVYNTNYVNAAAWLLPRTTIEKIGGFDPIFFHYGEDDNYLHRLLFHGLPIGICPCCTICHDTERRVVHEKFIRNTSKIVLLVRFSNINERENILNFFLFSIRKALFKIIKLKFHLAIKMIDDAFYVWKTREKIKYSIEQNSKQKANWL